jgi:glyoxylase-like metal-dependent hydrolase (beta-lactamase superfamily II)
MLDYLETFTVPTPFPVGPVNCYLARGEQVTLVDTGPKHPATLAQLRSELAARGLASKDIHRIVVTHAHVDHFGLVATLLAESDAQVLSHARNRWWLTDLDREWERRREFSREVFVTSGAPPEYTDAAIASMVELAQYAEPIPPERFTPLQDGDVVALGSGQWQVVLAPGHASGLICLYEPREQVLISSDHLLRDITSNPILEPPLRGEHERPRALVDYVASMEKTAQLAIRVGLPAHGEPLYDVPALVKARIAFHRQRLDHIEQQLGCCATTAWELCQILFPRLKAFDTFLGLSEVIGHLDVLEMEGRVRRVAGPVTRYEVVVRD